MHPRAHDVRTTFAPHTCRDTCAVRRPFYFSNERRNGSARSRSRELVWVRWSSSMPVLVNPSDFRRMAIRTSYDPIGAGSRSKIGASQGVQTSEDDSVGGTMVLNTSSTIAAGTFHAL